MMRPNKHRKNACNIEKTSETTHIHTGTVEKHLPGELYNIITSDLVEHDDEVVAIYYNPPVKNVKYGYSKSVPMAFQP